MPFEMIHAFVRKENDDNAIEKWPRLVAINNAERPARKSHLGFVSDARDASRRIVNAYQWD